MSDPAIKKIELWSISRIKPYALNAKKHPEEQIERLARAIKTTGWDQPIVVDKDGVIIKGHGRRLAALHLGLSKVPVIVRDDLTKEQADAARISDNATVSMQFDTKMLQEDLQRLMAASDITFTADDLGLSEKDKKLLLSKLDVPELEAIMDDTHDEIEKQKKEDADRVASADKEEMPLTEAFGFKKVSRDQGRKIALFMAEIEDSTGKKGPHALAQFLTELSDPDA